ncbi:hypothetical protein EGH82_17370 [Vibrio ponticus]|uniref:Uncharacterized protein n=1 Tax=Vibrio ponticus TaxID=265668 RepID=A0A3N3DW05_9VIBR|nr:hypothetical protein [Vibrio ponticus]ROV58694.1 hypothetical protein EGH82_17370 [Vibrio ponticus]
MPKEKFLLQRNRVPVERNPGHSATFSKAQSMTGLLSFLAKRKRRTLDIEDIMLRDHAVSAIRRFEMRELKAFRIRDASR